MELKGFSDKIFLFISFSLWCSQSSNSERWGFVVQIDSVEQKLMTVDAHDFMWRFTLTISWSYVIQHSEILYDHHRFLRDSKSLFTKISIVSSMRSCSFRCSKTTLHLTIKMKRVVRLYAPDVSANLLREAFWGFSSTFWGPFQHYYFFVVPFNGKVFQQIWGEFMILSTLMFLVEQ